jgi:predicted metallo-beta-lactamase superfamily hydrolase
VKITPLAFDSMGTRSMATFVETKDIKVLIDPSVALAPKRFGLPPHPIEIERMATHWKEIKRRAKGADILVLTHYHYDHHNPDEPHVWKNKVALVKDPKNNINKSQTQRSEYFLEQIRGLPKEIFYSDGEEFLYGGTKIKFSEAVPHGLEDRLGYVTEVLIDDGTQKFIHTSDVLGPCSERQASFILQEKPDVLFTDGPLYFTETPAIGTLRRIIRECRLPNLVIDHHLLRDVNWRQRIAEVFSEAAKTETLISSTAAFAGKKEELLEAGRKRLFSGASRA